MGITVRVDAKGLVPWKAYVGSVAEKAARWAARDSLRAMAAESSRQVRARKALKVAGVKKALTIIKPSRKQALTWGVRASGAAVPIAAYPHRQTKKGISVAINRGSRSFIRTAFVATMKSGHQGVFRRENKKRLPISELYTTTVADAFTDVMDIVEARGSMVFAQTFKRVVPLEAAKGRR